MQRFILLMALLVLSFPVLVACSGIENKIAVISLNGVIQEESQLSLFGGSAITPHDVRRDFQRAQNDITVKAIVVQVNTPGGDVSACQEIVYELERVKKPVVISMRSMATSGGYYISARANKIVALPTTLTGSIGVISQIPNLQGLFEKVGVKMAVIKSGKYKDMYSGTRELTVEEIQIMQKITDEMYSQFVDIVAEGRHISRDKVEELATGQAYTGIEAKTLGLVDELGGLQTAIGLAAQLAGIQSPQIEYYQHEAPGLLKLLASVSGLNLETLTGIRPISAEQFVSLELLNGAYPKFLYR